MEILLLVSRLLLASVFFVAGVMKLVDRVGGRKTLIDFGVPSVLATPFSYLLPISELAVAILLIIQATAWWGGVGALTLLLIFIIAISINLIQGRKPDCNCFGQIKSTPVGWVTIARNSFLAILAGFIVWQGQYYAGLDLTDLIVALSASEFVSFILITFAIALFVFQGWFLFHLLQQQGRLLLRLEALEASSSNKQLQQGYNIKEIQHPYVAPSGLPVGSLAPSFELTDTSAKTHTLDAFCALGKQVLLIFSDPECGACDTILPDIVTWQKDYLAKISIALISRGTIKDNQEKIIKYGLTSILLQDDREVAHAYKVHATPAAVLLLNNKIASPLALGPDSIRALVSRTVGVPSSPHPPIVPKSNEAILPSLQSAAKIGEPAPIQKLPDLQGNNIDITDLKGYKKLALFWNPGCGFCRQIMDELKAWETGRPEKAPALLVISSGTIEQNRDLEFQSPIILDQGFSIGRSFGARGTPSAVIIDEDNKIASPIATGGPAVLKLLGQ